MPLKTKKVIARWHQKKASAEVVTSTEVKAVGVGHALSVAEKSFAGLVEHKKRISAVLCEGKNLADIKDISFVKPF